MMDFQRLPELGKILLDDPAAWVAAVFKARPWSKQVEILRAIAAHPRVAVKSGYGVGKTTVGGWTALWYLWRWRPSIVLTTAPTARQVNSLLWGAIRYWLGKADAQGLGLFPEGALKPVASEIHCGPDWYAFGLTASDSDRFQGFHAEHILVVVDEAPGVPAQIWRGINGVLAGGQASLLLLGNPTVREGPFWQAFQPASGFVRLTISCLDHPNVTGEGPHIPGAVTHEWIEDQRRTWTEASPMWAAGVVGEFPDLSEGAELSLSAVMRLCSDEPPPLGVQGPGYMGVDVARFGTDSSVIIIGKGSFLVAIEAHMQRDLAFLAQRIQDLLQVWDVPPSNCAIDQTGIGAGVVDMLHAKGLAVIGVDYGSAADNPARFANRKAELQWTLARSITDGKWAFPKLPARDFLMAELLDLRFHYSPKGAIVAESKDDVRKRLGRSPDYLDAFTLLWSRRRIDLLGGEEPPPKSQGGIERWGEELAKKVGIWIP